jgi:hypothetical protein
METSDGKMIKKGTSPEQREAFIVSWKESGKSKKEFCSESGINYCTFISWLTPQKKHKVKQIKSEPPAARFSEIKLPQKSSEVLFARLSLGKSSLDLFQPVSADFLKRLLGS